MARDASPEFFRRVGLALVLMALTPNGYGEVPFLEVQRMVALQKAWEQGERPAAGKKLVKAAEALLNQPVLVVTEKKHVAESGDPHDYHSLARYWWPNPITKGKPYIRFDGEPNPELEEYDAPKLQAMHRAVLMLAKAFAVTGDLRYAEKAEEILRAWFVNPETRMNPHLKYAQTRPGLSAGSPSGIVEAVGLAQHLPVAMELLRRGKGVSEETDRGVNEWVKAFLEWLETSKFGKKIAGGDNNISTWYEVQRASFALLLGDREKARAVLSEAGRKRIDRQIKGDGSQPHELGRAIAYSYCCYNLDALITLSELGDLVGVDLWHHETPEGGSISKALDWLIPYAQGDIPFPYPQKKQISPGALEALLKRAAPHFPDKPYANGLRKKEKTGS